MRKKDILELKRRLKKDSCTFTKMCGCYVNGEKNILLKFNETFLNLEEDEFFKYLEIAKKTLSGTLGNNLLELEFPLEEEKIGSKQYDLMELKRSGLKNDALLDKFYESIINSYHYEGNYLILIFHDAYDVMTKTKDNNKLDESEEVYKYILCSICPVSLSKPGLRYFETDNRIGARIRDWVVEMPSNGFLFPAFTDRSSDVNSILYYTKNAKDTHPELMEEALGCCSKRTAAEQKESFNNILRDAVGGDEERSDRILMDFQDNLNTMIDEHNEMAYTDDEPITLTNDAISDILVESGVPEDITEKIEKSYSREFGDMPPIAEHLIDKKVLSANEQRKKEQRLEKQVEILQNKLERVQQSIPADLQEESAIEGENSTVELKEEDSDNSNYDIVLNVKPEKVDLIKSQIIDGKKFIVIPIEDNEQAKVNGVNTPL